MNLFSGQPMIPESIMQNMIELSAANAAYDPNNGGQYIPAIETRNPFRGAVLPLSETDIKRMPQGTYSIDTRKVYTNGHTLAPGSRIADQAGQVYTITGELDHTGISSIKRYYAERKSPTAAKGRTP